MTSPRLFFLTNIITPYNPLIKNIKGVIMMKTDKYCGKCLLDREGARKHG